MMSSLYLFFQHLLFCIFFYSVFSRSSHRCRENEKRNNFLARSSREIEPRLTGISSIYLFFSTLLFCIFFYLVVRIIDAERKRKRNNFLAMSFFLYFLFFYSLFFYSVFSRSNHRCREKDKGREIISRNRAKINRDFFFILCDLSFESCKSKQREGERSVFTIRRENIESTKRLTKYNSSTLSVSLFYFFSFYWFGGTRMKGRENFDRKIFWTIVEREGKRKRAREKILYNKFPIIEINLRASIFLAETGGFYPLPRFKETKKPNLVCRYFAISLQFTVADRFVYRPRLFINKQPVYKLRGYSRGKKRSNVEISPRWTRIGVKSYVSVGEIFAYSIT